MGWTVLGSILTLATLPVLTGCAEQVTMQVDHYQVPCWKMSVDLCFIVNGDIFTDSIRGFDFDWGTTYELEVEHSEQAPAADASTHLYELIEVVRQEAVPAGTQFTLTLNDDFVYVDPDQNAKLSKGPDLVCDLPDLCADVASLVADERTFEAVLEHRSQTELLVVSVAALD